MMKRPRKLWIALGLFGLLFCAFVGLWLWTQFGFEPTVVIYDTEQASAEGSMSPEDKTTQETTPALTSEIPFWFSQVRWSIMAAAIAAAIYVIYLETGYRRRYRATCRLPLNDNEP